VLGPDHPDTGDCRNKLAVMYLQAGRTDEASRLYDLINEDAEAMRSRNPIRVQTAAPPVDRTSGETPPRQGQKEQGS
jgi:hypothetical protein